MSTLEFVTLYGWIGFVAVVVTYHLGQQLTEALKHLDEIDSRLRKIEGQLERRG